jgi:hypothetical protein
MVVRFFLVIGFVFLFVVQASALDLNVGNISETDGFIVRRDEANPQKITVENHTGHDVFKVYVLVYERDDKFAFNWDDDKSSNMFVPVLPDGFRVTYKTGALFSGTFNDKCRARVYYITSYEKL